MKIIKDEKEVKLNRTAVALGKFDGFHLGHALLIENVMKKQAEGMTGVIFTFTDGDWKIGQNGLIDTPKVKREKAQNFGVDYLLEYPFTKAFANMEPEVFVKDMLIDGMSMESLTVGSDFRFGKDRKGDIALLRELSKRYGFTLDVFKKTQMDGEDISSSRIRREIEAGHMEKVSAMLNCGYRICGEVLHGAGLGHTIGYPTINQKPDEKQVLPPYGVYESNVRIEDKIYKGLTSFGVKPTVDADAKPAFETTILDFSGDLYGKEIEVELIRFIREEKKFPDVEALRIQIETDIASVKKIG